MSHVHASAETERLDSEYFQKVHLADEKRVKLASTQFRSFADLRLSIDASAFYPAIEDYYGQGNIPFLRVADVDTVIDFDQCARIPRELCERLLTLALVHPGDIIFTKGGSIARIGLVTEEAAASRDLIFLNSSELPETDRLFLYLYFQTEFFNRMLLRSSSQTAQPHLTITLVRNLPVFVSSQEFKVQCAGLVQKSYWERAIAIRGYKVAEQTLLRALGLEGWHPPELLTYARRASEVIAEGRLDAEHFQPKFNEMLQIVQTQGLPLTPLRELIFPIKNGYDYRNFVEKGTPYIRVGDISQCRINMESSARVALTSAQIEKDIGLRTGDILFTRKGSFGNAAPVRKGQEHAIISSEIMLIRRRLECECLILPEFLALFFNSLVGELQAEKWAHRVAFFSISQDDLNRFLVPMLPIPKQNTIRRLLEDSELARRKASILLEHGKRSVEIAIEESESAAMKFIKECNT